MLELLHDHRTRQSMKVETCAIYKYTTAHQPDTHSLTLGGFLGRCLTVLTLAGAERANSCSCRVEAREHPASPPARHASPPRSPSTRGDLEEQRNTCECPKKATVPTATNPTVCASLGGKKSKQTLWQKSWKPSLQTFLISSSPDLTSHTSSSRFRLNLPSSSSLGKDFKAVGTWAVRKPQQGTTSSLPLSIWWHLDTAEKYFSS